MPAGHVEALGRDVALVVERIEVGRHRPAAGVAGAARPVNPDFHGRSILIFIAAIL